MSLYQRLQGAKAAPEKGLSKLSEPVAELRATVHGQLIDELGPILFDRTIEPDELRRRVRDTLQMVIARSSVPLSASDRSRMIDEITDDIMGYGPIDTFLRDPAVTDILVNGPDSVYVERGSKLEKTDVTFVDETHLRRIIDKIVGEIGRRIDESSPLCDARLPDGSRVNAVIHPVALDGPFLTIRKFAEERLTVDDLIRFDTVNAKAARFLQACVVGRLNIAVSGGSSSGKTTTLNVLSSFIPPVERIITVEDAKELQLHQDHVLCLESRPPNVENQGEITIRMLVKNTLRMRPDRIVVGECRGSEALDMLQAMNTGHDGSLTTLHANAPRDALARLETLVLMAGYDLPVRAIREQLASALDLVVHMNRLRDGSRRITHITEVQSMEGDEITTQDVFLFDFGMGTDDQGKHRGRLKATGVRPKFAEKLADLGIKLSGDVFEREEFSGEIAAREAQLPAGPPVETTGGQEAAVADRLFTSDPEPESSSVADRLFTSDPEPESSSVADRLFTSDPEPESSSVADRLFTSDPEPESSSVADRLFTSDPEPDA